MGVLLVVACATAAVVATMRLGDRTSVLVLARPVTVGQVVTAQDLRTASIAVDAGVRVVPAGEAETVVGQTMAVTLPAGVLVTREALSASPTPAAGEAIAAVAVAPGQVPAEISPGARVLVVPIADVEAGTATGEAWPGTVTSVELAATGQDTVVSVQLADEDARQVAAVPAGQASLVLVGS